MSAYAEKFQDSNFTDLPILNGFSNWLISIFQVPGSASTWLTQIVLLMLTWYTMKFTFRLVMSILWPLLIISTILVIFHSIQQVDSQGLEFYACEKIVNFCNLMIRTFIKIPGFFIHS